MGRRRLLWTGAASILAIACAVWLLLPAPVPVDVAAVTRGPFTQTTDEQARTRIRDHYTVVAPLAGELDRIALREGDDVEAGAVVARLRPTLPALLDVRTQQELQRRVEAARAAKEAAEARVARAQVAQAQARLEVERSRKLAESHLVAAAKLETDELTLAMTAQELESARADAHVAQHDIDIAVAALGRAHAGGSAGAGSEWSLVAPIAGRVLRVHQKSAVTVTAGAPLVEFGDPGNLEVLIELLTTEAPPVVPGAVVRLTNWGGSGPLSGRVRRIERQIAVEQLFIPSRPRSPRCPRSASRSSASMCWLTSSARAGIGSRSARATDSTPRSRSIGAATRCRFPTARCLAAVPTGSCTGSVRTGASGAHR